MAESDRLSSMNDSIGNLLGQTRANMRLYLDTLTTEPSREYLQQYNQRIVELEGEAFNITQKQGEVANRINELEMRAIEQQFNTSFSSIMGQSEDSDLESVADDAEIVDDTTTTESIDNEVMEEVYDVTDSLQHDVIEEVETPMPLPRRNIIDDERFLQSLDSADLDDLKTAQYEEAHVEQLSNEYVNYYYTLDELNAAYNEATSQEAADSIYANYADAIEYLEALDAEIGRKWNFVIDTKYYAYGYIIEKERNNELLDKLETEFTNMLQQCANNDDLYASNGVMRYAIGRPAILDFEVELSSSLGINDATDSLRVAHREFVAPEYQLSPIELPEQRLFLDYSDITFGRTNYYNNANPIPDIKVYERGMIYRILLGVFKSRQPVTLFKGVQPLYIEKDASGLHHYYAGGFATLEEAERAQQLLYNKGFKAPEICCWIDGLMTNLTEGSGMSADKGEASDIAKRYMLRIAEEEMSDEIKQRITELHPSKMVTLTNEGYIVGTFDSHDETTRLFITLGDEFGIEIEIVEIEVK